MKKFDLSRSLLYIPAYNQKYILSALKSEADVLILDLEDSVPFSQKRNARKQLKEVSKSLSDFPGQVIIRINSIENESQVIEDLKSVNLNSIDGLMLPKVNNQEDLDYYEKMMFSCLGENSLYFIPIIETALAMFSLDTIARHSRVKSLAFGGEDYLTNIQGKYGKSNTIFDHARMQIILAAKAFGKKVIDTPFLALDDDMRFIDNIKQASELGFDGKQCIHPLQVKIVNQVMSPDEVEYKQSLKIISKINEAKTLGKGVAIFNGKMIGPPMVKRAKAIVQLYDLIEEKVNFHKRKYNK